MAYQRLILLHPHKWLETIPHRYRDPIRRTNVYAPHLPAHAVRRYQYDVQGRLVSHALRYLNSEVAFNGEGIDVLQGALTTYLRGTLISAGRRAGMSFSPGRVSNPAVLSGQLSLIWVSAIAADSAAYAISIWDPMVAALRVEEARRRGKVSSLGLTAKDLIPLQGMSISRQAAALGCSPRKVAYLRAELKALVEV